MNYNLKSTPEPEIIMCDKHGIVVADKNYKCPKCSIVGEKK